MIRVVLFLTIIFLAYGDLYSWDKDSSKKMIDSAEALMSRIDNSDFKKFVPYDYYTEAIIGIRNARLSFQEEKYELSYFYASGALVKLKTASVYAEAEKLRYRRIILERDYYSKKETGKKEVKKEVRREDSKLSCNSDKYRLIINANLLKRENFYRLEILDRVLFEKPGLKLSRRGKNKIDKIIEVLRRCENSRIRIVGHTGYKDSTNASLKKTYILRDYIIKNKIRRDRISIVGAGNRVVMYTHWGFRRTNRVEIVISGID